MRRQTTKMTHCWTCCRPPTHALTLALRRTPSSTCSPTLCGLRRNTSWTFVPPHPLEILPAIARATTNPWPPPRLPQSITLPRVSSPSTSRRRRTILSLPLPPPPPRPTAATVTCLPWGSLAEGVREGGRRGPASLPAGATCLSWISPAFAAAGHSKRRATAVRRKRVRSRPGHSLSVALRQPGPRLCSLSVEDCGLPPRHR
mmetsp:Transcript_7784/g.32775  ORF Transcript_7784/g.32775 Transcript_7784/m.32775 type:complete len:202 (+) Transcript_7784:57-662(+)